MARRKTYPLEAVAIIDPTELTPQMFEFINYYMILLNGTEAARLAKYNGDDATLASIASRLLNHVNVAREIDRRLTEHAMSANEVLARYTAIARGDIADVVNGVGATDLDEAKRRGKSHLVKRYKVKVTNVTEYAGTENEVEKQIIETEVEMYSALDALNALAKYHNLTNKVIVEDWRTEIIALAKESKTNFDEVAEEFGIDVAEELFISAGLLPSESGTGSEVSE